ncbi:NACHT and TPR domain protein [Ophiocordyceps sinensis CO18]|uniref:NACHT and TPR domain protein n=1 Tax=Ophiocordyceps sinensis (strain Co18 / CGMCC 3.14243) TaxID=911162 RepID=T5A6Z0_OPHSC|nr:NACHT and TPR domain protein [Ophiocordyceps sinensis CO18]
MVAFKPEPPDVERRFAEILTDAAKLYKDKSSEALDDFMTPPMKSVDDLKKQLSIQNDGFSAFRAKRQAVFDAVATALRPVELVGEIAAGAASTAYPPAQSIYAATLFLINAAHNVSATYDSVIELFDQLKEFTLRLDVYVRHHISASLRAQLVTILASLFEILVLATKEIRRGRFRAYLKRLIGSGSPVQPALDKLKALTLGEERQVLADTFGNLSELSTKAGQIEHAVIQVNQGVESLRVEHREFSSLPNGDKLREILSPSPFPEDIYNAFKKSTVPHTGDWILEDEGLNAWLRGEVPYLWIVGNAGTGKSYLTARIISWALDNAASIPFVGYFFFRENNSDTRSVLQALCDVAHQLSEKDAVYRKHLLARLESRDEIKTVAGAFRELFASPPNGDQAVRTKYIFFDGIDEADHEQVAELFANLIPDEATQQPTWVPHFQFAFVGRPILSDEITLRLDPNAPGQTLATVQVTSDRNASDVNAFIVSSVLHSKVLSRTSVDFKNKVIKALEKQADGLFLVAKFMLDDVNRKRHQSSILESLRTYPKEIGGVLLRTLANLSKTISDEDARDLNEMLRWVTCAEEPLTLGQLVAVLILRFGDPPLFLEESLRRQYSCFFDLEREDGLTTDDLVKDFERAQRDLRRDLSPARRLSSQHIRSLSAGEASAPPRRISPAGRGSPSRHSSPIAGHLSPTRRLSPAQGSDVFDTASDTEFRSNRSTTHVVLFHSSVRDFFRGSRSAQAGGPDADGLTVGFDIQEARIHVLKTCLRVFIDRDWFQRLELGSGKEALKQYAAWFWQEHACSLKLETMPRDEKRELGPKLYQMLTDESTVFDWSILYARNDEGLEVLTDGNIMGLRRWFQDADVVDSLGPEGKAFAEASSARASGVCEPIGRLYAKAWLSSEFEQYAPTLFCFKIVQNVAFMDAGLDWSHANLHWASISVEERVAKATQWAGQPETTHWHRRVGSTFLTLRMHTQALRHYDAALKMDKNSAETCSRIAYCLYEDGRYHDALEQALECAAVEERDIRKGGLEGPTLKNIKWRLYRDYLLVAQPLGAPRAADAALGPSESLEPETDYLEVLAAENLHEQMVKLAKEMSVQTTRSEHGQSRFVDLLLEQHSTLLVLDWMPKSASKTGQLEFLLERLEQAIGIADDMSDSLRFLYLRLALGTAYAYNRDIDDAIFVFEQISLLESRPRGAITTRQAHAASFQKLAALYKQKALHAGLKSPDGEGWISKLEAVQKKQEAHHNLDMPVDMLGSDINVASIYLACFYRLLGREAEARALLKGLIHDSLAILSDSEPQNDVFALDNLLRIFIAASDVPNAKALARSMRKVNPEASISTPGDSPVEQRGAPKLPGIQAYDRNCFQCFNNVSASKEFVVCRFCMECYCTDCLHKVIRRPGNSTKDGNSRVVCRSDHEWFVVEPLNRLLHTGEIQLEDDCVQGFAEWKDTVRKAWGLDVGFNGLVEV